MATPQPPKPPVASWKNLRDIVADTVGPMALLGAAAAKFVSISRNAAMNAEKLQRSLAASDGAARLRKDFELLLGSASRARQQVERLAKAASSSAFSFESLAQASKNLQVLTRGALNTEAGLKRVQDVAAATGAPVDQVAAAVGELYSALKRGDAGAEAAADQLQAMGAMSQQATNKVKALSAAGAGLGASWQVVQQDLSRANGAASELADTLSGLQQQLASLQNQSDIKIGDMMVEGEKAALKAAIGWQKLSNAISEANQAPWAAVNQAFQGINQSIGEFIGRVAESGAVKSVFSGIATAAIGVLTALTAATVAAIPVLLKLGAGALGAVARYLVPFAARLGITTASVGTFAASLRKVAFNPFTVGMTAIASVATVAAGKILEGANAVAALTEKMKEFNKERGKAGEQALVDAQTVRTPESKKAAQDRIRENIAASQARVRDLRENTLPEARRMKGNLFTAKAGTEMERTALNAISRESDFQQSQGAALDMLAGRSVGFDQQRLEMAERRAELEKEIAENARKAVQGSTSAANAKQMADAKVKNSEAKLAEAEQATKNRFEDDAKMAQGARDFEESRTARAEYDRANVEAAEYRKRIEGSSPSMKYEISKALDEGDYSTLSNFADRGIIEREDLNRYQAAIVKSGGDRPELNYGAFDVGATSKSGKIDSEISKRTALQVEEEDAIRRGSKSDLDAVRRKMADLKNPLTGASEFEGDNVMQGLQDELGIAIADGNQAAQDEIRSRIGEYASQKMATSDQRLGSELKTARNDESEEAAAAQLENDRITQQAAAEAEAADKAALAAGKRKLDLGKQLSALQGRAGGDGQAAALEGSQEIAEIEKKKLAIDKLRKAEEEYNKALEGKDKKSIKDARAKVDEARVGAMEVGASPSDTKESLDQEADAIKQQITLRQQQAAIEQSMAANRRNEIMQELRMRQQMTQLNFGNATGQTADRGGKSAARIEQENIKESMAKLDKAKGGVAERDSVRDQMGQQQAALDAARQSGDESAVQAIVKSMQGLADREKELDKILAGLGVDRDSNSQDLANALRDLGLKLAESQSQEIAANRGIKRDADIQRFSMMERYAGSQGDRMFAQSERKRLEDEADREARAAQYSKTMDPGDAEQLAAKEVELSRIQKDIDEAGVGRVDSLTAVGGGATGFLGGMRGDTQERIADLNEEIKNILTRIDQKSSEQMRSTRDIVAEYNNMQ